MATSKVTGHFDSHIGHFDSPIARNIPKSVVLQHVKFHAFIIK